MMPRAAAPLLIVLAGLGCTQETITVDVRSLERSGRSSFVCLGAPTPGVTPGPGLQLTECSRKTVPTPSDFSLPHLYALVTQTTRGEVAVIDLSTDEEPMLDQNPGIPGANFLPIGAQPIDIASTSGGTATFVTAAEIGREGIFALPSTMIRPSSDRPPPALSSWPACSLPSAPGDILIVSDPPGPEGERASCDDAYGAPPTPDPNEVPLQHGDLSAEALGRQKLVVTMPDMGGFIVVDAQRLLDRNPGSYSPCPVDRWVPLEVDLPPPASPPAPPPGAACVNPEVPPVSAQPIGAARPSGMAVSEDRLYVGDLEAPVIHIIDLPTPCEPVERAPLLPTSVDEPDRIITTSRIAVSRSPTLDFRRYLYAVDVADASAMVFDISDGATQRTPLAKPHPEWNPFQPPDRIRFNAPIRDILVLERDIPVTDPETGVAVSGVRCEPNPTLDVCSGESDTSCDPETLYRTSSAYDSGAGPLRLRGTFAFILLTSGQIAIIDIDDLDASCRVPEVFSGIQGCPPLAEPAPPGATPGDIDGDGVANETDNCPYHANPDQVDTIRPAEGLGDRCDGADGGLVSSNESSCNVVLPNAPRSANYVTLQDGSRNEPGLQTVPILYDGAGTTLQPAPELPQIRAAMPAEPNIKYALAVGGGLERLTSLGLFQVAETAHALIMNLEDPRAHVLDQAWTITYEGPLPGFGDNVGTVAPASDPAPGDVCGYTADPTLARWDLSDPSGLFCIRGVQSAESACAQLMAQGMEPGEATAQAALSIADFVEIISDLPELTDAYWTQDDLACSYDACLDVFGTAAAPSANRELRIREAREDRLILGASADASAIGINCCFGGAVHYRVRAGGQWVAVSAATGFLHHVIADPATGVCRDSCDPGVARLNGRIRPTLWGTPIPAGDPRAFHNPMFRMAISNGAGDPCTTDAACGVGGTCVTVERRRCAIPDESQAGHLCGTGADCDDIKGGTCDIVETERRCNLPPQRDMQFRFVTEGSFSSLFINLAAATADLQPQAMRFIPATGEMAITDGSLEGLILVQPATLDVSRRYY